MAIGDNLNRLRGEKQIRKVLKRQQQQDPNGLSLGGSGTQINSGGVEPNSIVMDLFAGNLSTFDGQDALVSQPRVFFPQTRKEFLWKILLRSRTDGSLWIAGQDEPKRVFSLPDNQSGVFRATILASNTGRDDWTISLLSLSPSRHIYKVTPTTEILIASSIPTNVFYRGGYLWQPSAPTIIDLVGHYNDNAVPNLSQTNTTVFNSTSESPKYPEETPPEWAAAFSATNPPSVGGVNGLIPPVEHSYSLKSDLANIAGSVTRRLETGLINASLPNNQPNVTPFAMTGTENRYQFFSSGSGFQTEIIGLNTTSTIFLSSFNSGVRRAEALLTMNFYSETPGKEEITLGFSYDLWAGSGDQREVDSANSTNFTGYRSKSVTTIYQARAFGDWILLPGQIESNGFEVYDHYSSQDERRGTPDPASGSFFTINTFNADRDDGQGETQRETILASERNECVIWRLRREFFVEDYTFTTPETVGETTTFSRSRVYNAGFANNFGNIYNDQYFLKNNGVDQLFNVLPAPSNGRVLLADNAFADFTPPGSINVSGVNGIVFQGDLYLHTIFEEGATNSNLQNYSGNTINPLWANIIGSEIYLVGNFGINNDCTIAIGSIISVNTNDTPLGDGRTLRILEGFTMQVDQVILDYDDRDTVSEGPGIWSLKWNNGSIYSLDNIGTSIGSASFGFTRDEENRIFITRPHTGGFNPNLPAEFEWSCSRWELDTSGTLAQVKRIFPSLISYSKSLQNNDHFFDLVNLQLQTGQWP